MTLVVHIGEFGPCPGCDCENEAKRGERRSLMPAT